MLNRYTQTEHINHECTDATPNTTPHIRKDAIAQEHALVTSMRCVIRGNISPQLCTLAAIVTVTSSF